MNVAPLSRRLVAELFGPALRAAVVGGSGIAALQLSRHDIGFELFGNAGISPVSAPAFVIEQALGGCIAFFAIGMLYPHVTASDAGDVVLPHADQDPADTPRGRIIAPTSPYAVESCVEGPSGLLTLDPDVRWQPSAPGGAKIAWPNGSEVLLLGTPTPRDVDRLRASGNRHIDVYEEMAANPQLDAVWDQAQLGLRLGDHPHSDFLRHAVRVAHGHGAMLVVERNHAGDYLTGLLTSVMDELGLLVAVRSVWASAGKRTRAEPLALLIEQGKVKWVGAHAQLEDEWASWDPMAAASRRTCSTRWCGRARRCRAARRALATSTNSGPCPFC